MRLQNDSILDQAVLINLDEWFAAHPIKEDGQMIRGEKVYESPRTSMMLTIVKDPLPAIGRHMHSTTDEIIFVYKGAGEMYINDKWVPVKAGDLHVCPRGVAHATRAAPGKELWLIGIYTPAQPKGGHDVVKVDA